MVLPWLIVGASAAMELRRGLSKRGGTEDDQQTEVHRLRDAQKGLSSQLEETKAMLEAEQAARDLDQKRLDELEKIKHEMEERMQALRDLAEQLELEKQQLKASQAALEERADVMSSRCLELEDVADLLRQENDRLSDAVAAMNAEDREAQVREMLEELKAAIAEALHAFGRGDLDAAGLRGALSDLGVDVAASDDNLAALRSSPVTSQAIEDGVGAQFDGQVQLITDSPDRLARLVMAAAQLRVAAAAAPPPEAPPLQLGATPSHSAAALDRDGAPALSFLAKLGALTFGAKAQPPASLGAERALESSAADGAAVVPAVAASATSTGGGVLGDITPQHQAALEAPVRDAKPKKAQKSMFGVTFKGISAIKHSGDENAMDVVHFSDESGGRQLVLK